MASLLDVARAANVSKSVASRVLSGDERSRISAATAEKVRQAARALGYVPNERARALRFDRSNAIALVVPAVTNSVFAELFNGVQAAASQADIGVLLGQVPHKTGGLADLVGNGRVDGVILQRPEDCDDAELRRLIDVRLPLVLFNSRLVSRSGSVTLSDEAAIAVAVRHLHDLGHRRIGFLGGTELHDAARRRARGYRSAMHALSMRIDRDWMLYGGWESEAGETGITRLLGARRPPTAVVVASVNAGLGAVSAAARQRVSVPDDLSVVAVQDTWFARISVPPLTVVEMPMRAAGAVAARLLLDHLSGAPLRDVVVDTPQPRLVVRESTAPCLRT